MRSNNARLSSWPSSGIDSDIKFTDSGSSPTFRHPSCIGAVGSNTDARVSTVPRFFQNQQSSGNKYCGTVNADCVRTSLPDISSGAMALQNNGANISRTATSVHIAPIYSNDIEPSQVQIEAFVEEHKDKLQKCSKCKIYFPSREFLQQHMASHANDSKVSCLHCSEVFDTEETYAAHKVSHVPQSTHVCSNCKGRFAHRLALKKHLLNCTTTPLKHCNNWAKVIGSLVYAPPASLLPQIPPSLLAGTVVDKEESVMFKPNSEIRSFGGHVSGFITQQSVSGISATHANMPPPLNYSCIPSASQWFINGGVNNSVMNSSVSIEGTLTQDNQSVCMKGAQTSQTLDYAPTSANMVATGINELPLQFHQPTLSSYEAQGSVGITVNYQQDEDASFGKASEWGASVSGLCSLPSSPSATACTEATITPSINNETKIFMDQIQYPATLVGRSSSVPLAEAAAEPWQMMLYTDGGGSDNWTSGTFSPELQAGSGGGFHIPQSSDRSVLSPSPDLFSWDDSRASISADFGIIQQSSQFGNQMGPLVASTVVLPGVPSRSSGNVALLNAKLVRADAVQYSGTSHTLVGNEAFSKFIGSSSTFLQGDESSVPLQRQMMSIEEGYSVNASCQYAGSMDPRPGSSIETPMDLWSPAEQIALGQPRLPSRPGSAAPMYPSPLSGGASLNNSIVGTVAAGPAVIPPSTNIPPAPIMVAAPNQQYCITTPQGDTGAASVPSIVPNVAVVMNHPFVCLTDANYYCAKTVDGVCGVAHADAHHTNVVDKGKSLKFPVQSLSNKRSSLGSCSKRGRLGQVSEKLNKTVTKKRHRYDFVCTNCGKTFSSNRALKAHWLEHVRERISPQSPLTSRGENKAPSILPKLAEDTYSMTPIQTASFGAPLEDAFVNVISMPDSCDFAHGAGTISDTTGSCRQNTVIHKSSGPSASVKSKCRGTVEVSADRRITRGQARNVALGSQSDEVKSSVVEESADEPLAPVTPSLPSVSCPTTGSSMTANASFIGTTNLNSSLNNDVNTTVIVSDIRQSTNDVHLDQMSPLTCPYCMRCFTKERQFNAHLATHSTAV